jgi:AGCS family alanine or glycine:cation symporter
VALGAVIALEAVWAIADVAMGLMALVNLSAILLLGKWAFAALEDYQRLRGQGRDPEFVASGNELLPAALPGDVW